MRRRVNLLLVLGLLLAVCVQQPAVRAQAAPMRVVLLVDSSSSMAPMFTEFRRGLAAFIEALPEDTEVAFISTGGQLRIRTQPTADRERLRKAVSTFGPDGGANAFLDAMLEADKRFLKPAADRKPVFVILTTDVPARVEPDIDSYNKFMNDFVRRHGRAYGIVIRANPNALGFASDFIENLTKNSGGAMDIVAVTNGLADRLRNIAAALAFGR